MRFGNKLGNGSKYIKRLPAYLETLQDYPEGNPLLMAVEPRSFQAIRRLGGLCLLCHQWPVYYDLSCCFGREVWVLHSGDNDLPAAMRLAQAVQHSGAAKIVVIQLRHERIGE